MLLRKNAHQTVAVLVRALTERQEMAPAMASCRENRIQSSGGMSLLLVECFRKAGKVALAVRGVETWGWSTQE